MIVAGFPASWRTDVTVHRGGTDAKGNPLPTVDHSLTGCLIGWRSTSDPVDRADLTTDTAVLYADDPLADLLAGDTLTVPAGPWPHGEFRVDGTPKPWPLGLEAALRRN